LGGRRRSSFTARSCLVLAAAVSVGCAGEFDTNRTTPKRGSLGREMYTLVCDRVGAQALREDVTGASFHAVCHADGDGNFATEVDRSKVPPLDASARNVKGEPVSLEQQQANRAHRIARIEAVARRREDLIAAFDAAFTGEVVGTRDLDNPDPKKTCDASPGKSSEAAMEKEVGNTLGRLTPLYKDDTIPNLTRGLSRVMNAVEASPEAQAALTKFDARRGYKPTNVAMGVARPTLSYPRLVEMANALLRLVSKSGPKHAELEQLMTVTKEELRTAQELPSPGALTVKPDARDASIDVLSRPRGNLEIARSILLHQDAAFAIGEPRFVVARDVRGFAKVTLANGKVPSPFVDSENDGLADVDDLGRFVTTSGAVAPQPFIDFFGEPTPTQRDATGRAAPYEYVDVSSTWLASLSKDLVPMLEPDPAREHETLMDLLSGFVVVAGTRDEGATSERVYEGGVTVPYRAYREDDAPVLDLVHGIGQVLADPTTDDTLALVHVLARDKPAVLARLIGVGLAIKKIGDQHPEAVIPEASALWDEMLDVVAQIAGKPLLVEDIIRAFGDPATVELAKSAVAYMSFKDEITYNRDDLNGPPFDKTTGKVELMKTKVDRTKPDTGANKSAFQRFLSALHDTKGMSVCNKQGAVAHIKWNGVSMDFPSTAASAACFFLGADTPPNPMPMCGMLRIKNISQDLVDAVLGAVNLDIRDDCMKKLVGHPLTGIVGGADAFLEDVSGIQGFTTKPTVPAISRLVYFDLPYAAGQTGDTKNPKTLSFLKDLFDIVPTLACPQIPFTDTDGVKLNLRQCQTFQRTLRQRDPDALFPLEQFGFLEAAKPLARAFQKNDANLLFVDLFDVLHRHWGSAAQSKEECDPSLPKTDARWCSQSGASSYEPLLAEALAGDLFPALLDSVKELETIKIKHCEVRGDGPGVCTKSVEWDGVKVLAEAVKAMVDPAKNKGLRRRNGDASAVRNDGTKNAQVTPIYLLIDALKGFDRRLVGQDDRKTKWRRARSQIVDQLFAVDGSGKASRMKNAAIEKMLPVLIATTREQVAANCPNPATKGCTWGREELPKKMKDVVTGPTFAATMDVLDAIVSDEAARTELERLLGFLLQSSEADAQKTMLASLTDVLQVFEDDANLTALLHASSDAAGKDGMLMSAVEMLARVFGEVHDEQGTRLCGQEIDPNRTLAVVLRRLVAVPEGGGPPPIEVLIDVAADVNRKDPSVLRTTKLEPVDYANIAHEVSEFCSHPSRGLEQVYEVIKQATKDQ
jgi:hypothetical protein